MYVMMNWIEMIRARSSASALQEAGEMLKEQVSAIKGAAGLSDVVVLRHALYDGDLAVLLVWKNGCAPVKSREGMVLAESLQHLGSVDHAVWTVCPD